MAGRVRDILVRFLGDDKDLIRSQQKVRQEIEQTESRTSRMGKTMSSVGSSIKTVWGTAVASAIAVVGAELIELAVKADRIRRRFAIVFGEMSDEMTAWADDMNEKFGVGQVAAQDMAAQIQDLLVPLGFAREEAADLTKKTLEGAAALSQWTGGAFSMEDAAKRIRKALLGEREGLEELGVKILESHVQHRLLEKGQEKLIGNELERAKVLATLELIQEKTTDAMALYRSETDKAAIAQREMTAAYQDAKQELADKSFDIWAQSVINARDAMHGANKEIILSQLGFLQFIPGVREMIRAWDDSIISQQNAAESMRTYHDAIDAGNVPRFRLVQDTRDFTGAAEEAKEAANELRDAQKEATNPFFAAQKAQDRLTDAHGKWARAVAESGSGSKEAQDALGGLIEAQRDADSSSAALRESFSGQSLTAIQGWADQMGIARDVLEDYINARLIAAGLPPISLPGAPTVGGNVPGSGQGANRSVAGITEPTGTNRGGNVTYQVSVYAGANTTPTQAHQLGAEVVRGAEQIRRERTRDVD